MSEPASVVVTWPNFDPDGSPGSERLREAGAQIVLAPKTGPRTPAEVARIMAGAAGAVVSTDPFDRSVLERLPDLRVIARVGVGTDSIDLEAATAQGIFVTTTPGANEHVVADHALALMLGVIRRVIENDASVRAGRWDRVGPLTPGQLSGRTVGIIGFGTIGMAVASRLRGFGVRLLAHDPYAVASDMAELVPLDELLRRSDVITVHVPMLPSTRHLLGPEQLAMMPEGAIVINTARGGIIHEDALADALISGHLAGAGLDVFEAEPPAGSRLSMLSGVMLSPHIAGLSVASIAEMTERACRSVAEALGGAVPRDAVNPEAAMGADAAGDRQP